MNRRGFLSLLAGAAAAPLVPELGRVHFLPPPCGWVSSRAGVLIHRGNTLLTVAAITREASRILHEELMFVRDINREYDPTFAPTLRTGDRIRIEVPS